MEQGLKGWQRWGHSRGTEQSDEGSLSHPPSGRHRSGFQMGPLACQAGELEALAP